MSRLQTVVSIITLILVLALTQPAQATKEFECFVYASMRPQLLFTNTGTFASDTRHPVGPTLVNVDECEHKGSGLYLNLFSGVPLYNTRQGWETDERGGVRLRLTKHTVADLSVALYQFGTGDRTHHTLDFRAKISHDLTLGRGIKIGGYALLDYQHPLNPSGEDWVGIGGGPWMSTDLPLPGKPNLYLEAGGWYWPKIPTPSGGPIGNGVVRVKFPFGGLSPNSTFERTERTLRWN